MYYVIRVLDRRYKSRYKKYCFENEEQLFKYMKRKCMSVSMVSVVDKGIENKYMALLDGEKFSIVGG